MKDCNYASLIKNNKIYSIGLENDINTLLKSVYANKTLCFNTKLVIDGDSDDDITMKLITLLNQYQNNEDVTIIYLGYSFELTRIINSLQYLLSTDLYTYIGQVTILTSEAVLNDLKKPSTPKINLYSIMLDAQSVIDNTDLVIYYTDTLNPLLEDSNNTEYRNIIYKKIPWLLEFIMVTLNCTFNDSTLEIFQRNNYNHLQYCDFSSTDEKLSTTNLTLLESQYLSFLTYSLAALYTELVNVLQTCSDCNQDLSDNSIKTLAERLRNNRFDFTSTKMIPYYLQGVMSITNGIFRMESNSLYSLYDYNIGKRVCHIFIFFQRLYIS